MASRRFAILETESTIFLAVIMMGAETAEVCIFSVVLCIYNNVTIKIVDVFGPARFLERIMVADIRYHSTASETESTVAVMCAVMVLAGSLQPALRALRIDPAHSIREE